MSLPTLIEISRRLMSDKQFVYRLLANPDAALEGLDLTPEEIRALETQDRWLLESCGLEEWTARWISTLS